VKKLMVYLDEDMHEDLRQLAFHKKTTMAALVRYALDKTFEDELDLIAAERALEEAARDPSSTVSWEEYKAQRAARGVRAAS
jgi:predicted DNA-binding protein